MSDETCLPPNLTGGGAVDRAGLVRTLLGMEVPLVPFLPKSLLQGGIARPEQ